MSHTNDAQDVSDQDDDHRFTFIVKDFGYDVSDPKHFGIYDDDDDEEEEYEEEDYEDGESDINDEEEGQYENEDDERYFQNTGMFSTKDQKSDPGRYIDNMEHLSHTTSNVVTDDTYFAQGDGNNEILHAVALYPFVPENSNELSLVPDQILIINYECGDGWLVAHDPETGETGLVPSEYIKMLEGEPSFEQYDSATYNEFAEDAKDAHRFMPELLGNDDDEIPTDKLNNLTI